MSVEEFYDYMSYLTKIGVNRELLGIFEKTLSNCHNENPGYLLDSLTTENVCRAHRKVYNQTKDRLR